MPNLVKVTVDGVDDLLNAGMYDAGAIIRLQSCATETGVYANEATAALVSGTAVYTMFDVDGASTTWYRTRYENAGGTVTSDWAPVFQAGGEEAGYLCSLYDVKQALGLTATTDDEPLTEHIRQVTAEVHSVTGRLFVRTPSGGTATWTEDVGGAGLASDGQTLWYPKGLAALTTLEVATTSQPESAGTYATVAAADWFLRPTASTRDDGWPATRVVISDRSGSYFAPGYNTVRLTGARGWATIPPNISAVALRAVVSAYLSKGSGGVNAAVGPTGAMTILRHISPADMGTLMRYAVVNV